MPSLQPINYDTQKEGGRKTIMTARCPEGTYASQKPAGLYEFELVCRAMTRESALQELEQLLGSINRFSSEAIPAIAMVARYTAQHESRVRADFEPLLSITKQAEQLLVPLTTQVGELIGFNNIDKARMVAAQSGVSVATVARIEALFFKRLGELAKQLQLDVMGFDVQQHAAPTKSEAASWFGGGQIGTHMQRFWVAMNRLGLLSFESLITMAASMVFGDQLAFVPVPSKFQRTYEWTQYLCSYLNMLKTNRPLIDAALKGTLRLYEEWARGGGKDVVGLTPTMRKSFAEIDRLMAQNPKIATAAASMTTFSHGVEVLERVRPKRGKMAADDLVAHNLPAVRGWFEMFDSFMETKGVNMLAKTCSVIPFTYMGNDARVREGVMTLLSYLLPDPAQAQSIDTGKTLDYISQEWTTVSKIAWEREYKRRLDNYFWAEKQGMDVTALYQSLQDMYYNDKAWMKAYQAHITTPGSPMPKDPTDPTGTRSLFSEAEGHENEADNIKQAHEATNQAVEMINGANDDAIAVASATPASASVPVANTVGIGFLVLPMLWSAAFPQVAAIGMAGRLVQLVSVVSSSVSLIETTHQWMEWYNSDTQNLLDWAMENQQLVAEAGMHVAQGADKALKQGWGQRSYSQKAVDKQVVDFAPWIAASLLKSMQVPSDKKKRDEMMLGFEKIGEEWIRMEKNPGSFSRKINAFMEKYTKTALVWMSDQSRDASTSYAVILAQLGNNAVNVEKLDGNGRQTLRQIIRNLHTNRHETLPIDRFLRANPGLLGMSDGKFAPQIADAVGQISDQQISKMERLGQVPLLQSLENGLHIMLRDQQAAIGWLPYIGLASGSIFLTGVEVGSLVPKIGKLLKRYRREEVLLPVGMQGRLITNEAAQLQMKRFDTGQTKFIENFNVTEFPTSSDDENAAGWWRPDTSAYVEKLKDGKEHHHRLLARANEAAKELLFSLEVARTTAKEDGTFPVKIQKELKEIGRLFVAATMNPNKINTDRLNGAVRNYLNTNVVGVVRDKSYKSLRGAYQRWYSDPMFYIRHVYRLLPSLYGAQLLDNAFLLSFDKEISSNEALGRIDSTSTLVGPAPNFGSLQISNVSNTGAPRWTRLRAVEEIANAWASNADAWSNETITTQQDQTAHQQEQDQTRFDQKHNSTKTDREEHSQRKQQEEKAREELVASALYLLSAFVMVMAVAEELPDISAFSTPSFNSEMALDAERQLAQTGTLADSAK